MIKLKTFAYIFKFSQENHVYKLTLFYSLIFFGTMNSFLNICNNWSRQILSLKTALFSMFSSKLPGDNALKKTPAIEDHTILYSIKASMALETRIHFFTI